MTIHGKRFFLSVFSASFLFFLIFHSFSSGFFLIFSILRSVDWVGSLKRANRGALTVATGPFALFCLSSRISIGWEA